MPKRAKKVPLPKRTADEKRADDLAKIEKVMTQLPTLLESDDDNKFIPGCKVLHKALFVGTGKTNSEAGAALMPEVVHKVFAVLKTTQRTPARVTSSACRQYTRKIFQRVHEVIAEFPLKYRHVLSPTPLPPVLLIPRACNTW
jgi:hypothetical protein